MCKSCGCNISEKPVQYECDCKNEDCCCSIIEFNDEPRSMPYCCGIPMKKIKG